MDLRKLLQKVEGAPHGSSELDSEFESTFRSVPPGVTRSIDAAAWLIESELPGWCWNCCKAAPHRGHFRRAGLIDLHPHQVGGLGHEVWFGVGFCCSSKPRTISGGVAVGAAADDLVTAVLTAAALTVDLPDLLFAFVILRSPEKPKGPGEGPCGRTISFQFLAASKSVVACR